MFLLPLVPTAIQTIRTIYHSFYTGRKLQTWEKGGNRVWRVKSSFHLISVLIPRNEFQCWSSREQKRRNNSGWFFYSTSWASLSPLIGNFGRSQSQSNRFCYGLRNIPDDIEKWFPFGLNTQMIVDHKDITQQCSRAAQTKFLCNADFSQKLIYDKGCLNWVWTFTSGSGSKNKKKGRKRRIKPHCLSKALLRPGSDSAAYRGSSSI